MNDTLHRKIFAMAAAAIGAVACGGGASTAPSTTPTSAMPKATEVPTSQAAEGSQASCGAKGQASCGAKSTLTETKTPASCGAKTASESAEPNKDATAKPMPKKGGGAHEASCAAASCGGKTK